MIPLGKLRSLALLAVASAGLLGGHSLTYLGLAPEGSTRAGLLEASGHGYLDRAVVFTAALAMIAALFWLADGALRSRYARPAMGPTVLALALIQVLGFAGQEVLERLMVGASLGDLAAVMTLGIPLQLMVAGLGALLVTTLHRVGRRIAELLAGSGPAGIGSSIPRFFPTTHFRSAPVAGGLRTRGPPALSS